MNKWADTLTRSEEHYNYFRDYDASTGRYLKSDPLWLAAGPNTFAYVLSNPLGSTDQFGLEGASLSRYGNWCGKNWSGGNAGPKIPNNPGGPIDSLDECCKSHDYCYAQFECGDIACGKSDEKKKGKQKCDDGLVACLTKLKNKPPENWPKPPRPGTETDAYFFCQKAYYYFK